MAAICSHVDWVLHLHNWILRVFVGRIKIDGTNLYEEEVLLYVRGKLL